MVEGTEYADEFSNHRPSIFQIRSRAHARHLIHRFLNTGVQPVITKTFYEESEWEECEDSEMSIPTKWDTYVEEAASWASFDWYYLCARESVDSTMCCFCPHLSEEAAKLNVEIKIYNKSVELIDINEKYEEMAAAFGYAA